MLTSLFTLLLVAAVDRQPVEFLEVNDLPAPVEIVEEEPESVAEVEYEPEWDWEPQYQETGVTGDYSEPNDWYEPQSVASDGLNSFTGVNYHDGRTETYYSSNVLYHYRTPEWTLDSEGFWRTEEGYYVVAASDMEQGATFKGSKGTCIVLDMGCNAGVTDYYVNW